MPFSADHAVPALIVKFGDYPLHHGGVGAIRSLGRRGVPMYAITEDPYTPAASSRYLQRAFVWPTIGTEEVTGAAGDTRAVEAQGAKGVKGANGATEVDGSGSGVGFVGGWPVLTVRELGGRTRELSADHVIAAMDFLGHELRTELAVSRGRRGSVPGMLPAAVSYGPVMRFVCGTEFASPRLAGHLAAAHR